MKDDRGCDHLLTQRFEAGMLDPQVAELLRLAKEEAGEPLQDLTPAEARDTAAQDITDTWLSKFPEQVADIRNLSFQGPGGSIPLRLYVPHGNGPFPVLLFFHGGGWVICSLDTHDNTCRALANRARCLVISVDYRLAPEAKFPAAVQDAYAAAQWAVENAGDFNGDPTRVAVGGDSAGGNLSAALALMARDEGGPPLVYQLLIYPVTDVHTFDRDSYREYTEGYVVTREEMAWYRDHYLQDVEEARDPYVSPLLCPDLSGLPAAHVVTAEYDVLRDEGEAYARRLKEAGNAVTCTRYNGMVHGFMSMDGAVDKAGVALTEVSDKLCLALHTR